MKRASQSPLATPAIDEIWRRAATTIGFTLSRTQDAYATSDGRGEIAIGATDTLDGDDALGQLVFHELCHAITEGEASLRQPDWGLDNVPEHVAREHACLRVQALVSDRFALRAAMAPTTPYRDYYAALPADPLAGAAGDGDAVARAAAACARFDASTWRAPIEQALSETAAAIGRAKDDARAAHPLGFALGPAAETCGTCAWAYDGGRGVAVTRCRQSAPANGDGARTARGHRACVHWEAIVDCRTCGACCREAYHSVTVSMRDPVIWQEPDLIVRHGPRFEIRREGSRCAALVQMGTLKGSPSPPAMGSARQSLAAPDAVVEGPSYTCAIYENRPRPCREFAAGGRHCLDARRRVGLSPTPASRATSPPAP
jgi:hypothetical protein